jgi:hypothetical protein
LGEGTDPMLLRRIRMHGNLAENAPLFLILLALVEMTGQWSAVLPYYAAAFVIARVSHALGLAISSGATPFRFVGVIGTIACDIGLASQLAITLSRDTHWIPHF